MKLFDRQVVDETSPQGLHRSPNLYESPGPVADRRGLVRRQCACGPHALRGAPDGELAAGRCRARLRTASVPARRGEAEEVVLRVIPLQQRLAENPNGVGRASIE
jgi:hypothetical protein